MLPAGCDVFMACQPAQRVARAQQFDQLCQPSVLRIGEWMLPIALEFDADRKIVAALATKERGRPGMPSAQIGCHELNNLAASPHQQMRRHL